MSQYGQVQVKNSRYKFRGDFHRLEQHMPIRDADNEWKLVGVTKPRDLTYVHTYGGEAAFFEALSQGKLLPNFVLHVAFILDAAIGRLPQRQHVGASQLGFAFALKH